MEIPMLRRPVAASLVLLSLVALSSIGGCTAAEGSADAPECVEVEVTPQGKPSGVYRVVHAKTHASKTETAFKTSGAPHRTIFVNKDGATLSPGDDDSSANRSSIVGSTTTIPAYEKDAASWSQFLTCIQGQFARFNVTVTDVDPGATPHLEAIVGGYPGLVGLGGSVGGVSPMMDDCSLIETSIVYVFSQQFDSPQVECQVAAQELGHSIGMDHEFLCEDPMTYLYGCGDKTFQDVDASCGESSPRTCMCGGATQNSVQFLTDRLGLAGATPPPTPPPPGTAKVDGLVPDDGATLEQNTTIDVGASVTGASKVFLRWTIVGDGTSDLPCATLKSGVTCDVAGGRYTWHLPVGTGTRTWSIHALDAASGAFDSPTRSLTLTSGTTPPSGTPSVVTPAEGASFAPGADVRVRVDLTGVADLDSVWLRWNGPAGDTMSPLKAISSSQWGIDLSISNHAATGPRTLGVTAWTHAGVAIVAPSRTIHVGP